MLPYDLPPWSAVYYYFTKWSDDGTDQVIQNLLRWQVREGAGRAQDPTAVLTDSQTVRAANNVPASATGLDPGKRPPGRKRQIATAVIGLIIAVVVMAASAHDNAIGTALPDRVVVHNPSVTKAWWTPGSKTRSPSTSEVRCRGRSGPPRPGDEGLDPRAEAVGR